MSEEVQVQHSGVSGSDDRQDEINGIVEQSNATEPKSESGPATSILTTTTTTPSKAAEHHLSLQSSRPAPPSPASSRPTSTVILSPEPVHFSTSSPSSLGEALRDRSGSTSSRGGRRISAGSSTKGGGGGGAPRSRASSAVRPRSTLGTSVSLPSGAEGDEEATPREPIQQGTSSSGGGLGLGLGTGAGASRGNEDEGEPRVGGIPSTILEHVDKTSETTSQIEMVKLVIIRDYAYTPSDERHHGRGAPLPQRSSSTSGFKWPWRTGANGESPDPGTEEDEESKRGWGGFGLLGWRGFSSGARRSNRSSSSQLDGTNHSHRLDGDRGGEDDEVDGESEFQQNDDGEEYFSSPEMSESDLLLVTQHNLEPSYAFTVLPALEDPDEEPKGLYRAAYAFEGLSSSEMSLEEGDLLMINGRGNGDPGWVIARKMSVVKGRVEKGDEKVGLVPEGYLERVEVVKE
ncbi:hypothetical protein CI109_106561 [Kwoniella shandongensis]|uniref:Uncharacterized protein n=1 Tax=Kwoniella shandongensis TaxID=1734106 RepID=A0A5M6C6A1_9TREE|nr:uncharacterized protein CI109_002743 [Kwoniella shandongensis]KAA5528985.1 hypothetical protein CI109_002743 [Kwoniella shandongensis]